MQLTDIAAMRLRSQQIAQADFSTPAQLVAWMGALQAQDFAAAKWALGLRLPGMTERQVEQAFNAGEILRTHIMRPTWHFVSPADIRWLLALTAPRVNQANAYMYRRMELEEATFQHSNAILLAALSDGQPRTREELGALLENAGLPAVTIRLGYLLHRAELDGLICSGPRRGKHFTYAQLDHRAPPAPPLSRAEALAGLTLRYFTSHGPAQASDFAWWSGLTLADARAGLRLLGSTLRSETLAGSAYWFNPAVPTPAPHPPTAHLLPAFDEYGIAYQDHSAILSEDKRNLLKATIYAGTVELDGQLVGSWHRTLARKQVRVEKIIFPL
jgi:hypothetical protein